LTKFSKNGRVTGMKKIIVIAGFISVFAGTPVFAGYFDNSPAYNCEVRIVSQMSYGSESTEVAVLQSFLNRAGYLNATPNGYFGYATRSAVQNFQRDNGISATGTVGPATRNAINERFCDTNLNVNTYSSYDSYNYGGYSSGVTYVDAYDPYVRNVQNVQVVSPSPVAPVVYNTPQSNQSVINLGTNYGTPTGTYSSYTSSPVITNNSVSTLVPGTSVMYTSQIGYTYGITPSAGSLTISTPTANSFYNEGDTVYVAWTTNNLNNSLPYRILLESSSGGQSKVVAETSNTNASFVLTKEIMDAVCSGSCSPQYAQGTFRIVVTTPVTDIAGNTTTLRAIVSPVTIKRPYAFSGTVSIGGSKSPVNSGELFKLYVNIPTGAGWNANLYGQYSITVRAICPNGVSVNIAGSQCGQEFTIPFAPVYFQSEIPATIINTTWYQQNVGFELTVKNLNGQVIGQATTNVVANGIPFQW
jgi:peptidoglycan hydrolase-like protein with peptidoglycan-binding domain